jgi:hypothetical protein
MTGRGRGVALGAGDGTLGDCTRRRARFPVLRRDRGFVRTPSGDDAAACATRSPAFDSVDELKHGRPPRTPDRAVSRSA